MMRIIPEIITIIKLHGRDYRKYARAFTLVEILVAVSIISLLAGFVLTAVFNAREQSRDQSRITDIDQLKLGLKLYKEAYREYPDYPDSVTIGTGQQIDTDLARVLGELKGDPINDAEYTYVYDSDFECNGISSVVIYAQKLENPNFANADEVCGAAADYYIAVVSKPVARSASVPDEEEVVVPDTDLVNDIPGCTDVVANNYDENATVSDGSCDYSNCITDSTGTYCNVEGCMDSNANNYNNRASISDPKTCTYDIGVTNPWEGCTWTEGYCYREGDTQ